MRKYNLILLLSLIVFVKSISRLQLNYNCSEYYTETFQEFFVSENTYYASEQILSEWNPFYFLLEDSAYCYLYNFIKKDNYYLVRAYCLLDTNIQKDLMKIYPSNETKYLNVIEYIDNIGSLCDKIKPQNVIFKDNSVAYCEKWELNASITHYDLFVKTFTIDNHLETVPSTYLIEYLSNYDNYFNLINYDKCRCPPENYLEKCEYKNKRFMNLIAKIYIFLIILLLIFIII